MPTIGFSKCDVNMKNASVTFYDLGGCSGIRDIWKNYYAETHGLIYVVDGTDWSRVEESRLALSGGKLFSIINKRRAREEISELVFAEQLQLRRYAYTAQCPYRAIACSPGGGLRQRLALRRAVHWLLHQIELSGDWISDKIAADRAVQKRQLEEENAKRLERIRNTRSPLRRAEPDAASTSSNGSRINPDAEKAHKATGEPKGEVPSDGNDVESIELSAPPASAKASTSSDHTVLEELENRTEEADRSQFGRRRKHKRLAHFNRVVPLGGTK